MDLQRVGEETLRDIDDLQKKIKKVSAEREKLMHANRVLSSLVLQMEKKMNEYGIDPSNTENPGEYNNELSSLDLGEDFQHSDIIQQINEVEHLLEEVEIYK